MNQNGGPQGPSQAPELITLSITLNPATKKVAISIPKDLGQAYLLARQLLDAIVNLALNPEPERKVKDAGRTRRAPGSEAFLKAGTCTSTLAKSSPMKPGVNSCRRRGRVGTPRRLPFASLGSETGVTNDEERICYVHGRLVRQFMYRAYDAGLYGS